MRNQLVRSKQKQGVSFRTVLLLCLSIILMLPWTTGLSLSDSRPDGFIENWRDAFAEEDIPLGEFLEWMAQQIKAYGESLENWPASTAASYQEQLEQHLEERQNITDKAAFNQRVKRFALNEAVTIVKTINFLFEDWNCAPYTVQAQYTWLVVTYALPANTEIMVFPNSDEIKESVAIAAAKEFLHSSLNLSQQVLNDYVFRTSFVDDKEYGHRVWLIQTGLPNENAIFLVIDGKTGEVIKNTVF